MSCSQLPDWYRRRRIAVIDLSSPAWHSAQAEVLPSGYKPDICLGRLRKAGRIRRVTRGVYLVTDPVRETPAIAIASQLFGAEPHYVSTDAALSFHGLIDQPIRRIVVVLSHSRRPIDIGQAVVWPVKLRLDRLGAANAYDTTLDGFKFRVATREQAVVDALAEPAWMVNLDLLAEVLAQFTDDEIKSTAGLALRRSTAAAQRLGFLLQDAQRTTPASLANLKPVRAVRLRPGVKGKRIYSTRWRVYG
jgi:predicted transcriptional regulator of viral defense system